MESKITSGVHAARHGGWLVALVADQRYPIGCVAVPAGAGHGGERRLTLRGRSPTIRGLCLEVVAQQRPISPRCRSARRKATATPLCDTLSSHYEHGSPVITL
jgi:hypothetical protein